MISKSDALVIRCVRYSETSMVVTYYTCRYGQMAVLAKGARKPPRKGRFHRPPDLLCTGELVFYPPRQRALGIQSEWSEYNDHPHLRASLPALRAGLRLTEVLGAISRDSEPMSELFHRAVLALAALNVAAGPSRPNVAALGLIILHFDLHALRLAGYGLTFGPCAACGEPLIGRGWVLAPLEGGVLCEACCRQARNAADSAAGPLVPLPRPAVAAASHLLRCDVQAAARVQIAPAAHRALRAAIDAALETILERTLRCFETTRRRWREAGVTA